MSMCRDPEDAQAKGLSWQATGKVVIEGAGLLEFDLQQHETFSNILQYVMVFIYEKMFRKSLFISNRRGQEEYDVTVCDGDDTSSEY